MSRLHRKLFEFTQQSWEVFQRMFARSVTLALLTSFGFALVDHLVDSGISDRFALVHRFPEFIPMMLAAAKLTFIEMSVFWIRFATQPGTIDTRHGLHEVLEEARFHPGAVVALHAINTVQWAFRVVVLIYLAQ